MIPSLLDSSTSRHVTGTLDNLFNVTPVTPVSINLLNDFETYACHKGSIFMSSTLFLTNVLYVPNMKCNFIIS